MLVDYRYCPFWASTNTFVVLSFSPQSHEITHAFNPDTLQFDEFGQKNNQWSNDSSKVYDAMTEALVRFYAAEKFNVGVDIGGGKVDGKTGIQTR